MEVPFSKLNTPTANTNLSTDGESSNCITDPMSKQHKRRPFPPPPSRKADNVVEVRLSLVYRLSKSAVLVVLATMLILNHHPCGNNVPFSVDASTVSAIPTHRRQDDERNTMNHHSTLGSPTPFVRATRRFLQEHQDPAGLFRLIQHTTRRGQATLAHSIPALSVYSRRKDKAGSKRSRRDLNNGISDRELVEVAVKQKKPSKDGSSGPRSLPNPLEITSTFVDHAGFYYGIDTKTISKHSAEGNPKRPRKPKLQDSMTEALEELRILRQEMERMRQEVHTLKLKMVGEDEEELSAVQPDSEEVQARKRKMLRKKQKEAERLAADIESWAQQLLQEGEEEGWKQVECNKMIRGSLNEGERTSAYMKWMKDSRADKANPDDDTEYPCIKCYSTIDAPLEDVCTYLSQEAASAEYNDVVEKHKDVEEISPSAKICWSQSPQILFIKPRDFVTFCHHRWKKDGTEIIVNQACDHPDFPLEKMDKEGKSCRGYALRGANCKTC
jgi:START domain